MKRLLIVGAGIEQVPAIKIAKQMGLFVISTDYNPKAPGFKFADKTYEVSTHDAEANLKIALKEKIDGVMTICSETAVPVVGFICEKMNLNGINLQTGIKSTHKGAMRKAMKEYGVAMPEREVVSTLEDAQKFCSNFSGPWVLKPTDSSGQRGTTLINSINDLKDSFESAKQFSSDGNVLIDQFIEGQEINVNAIVKNGEVEILSLADRNTLPHPHFGIAVFHIAPPNILPSEVEAVKELARNAIKAIGLTNGLAYPQIIVTKEGPKLIEIAARMPGGYNREMAINLSGIDPIKAQILISIGQEFNFNDLIENEVFQASGVKLLTSVDYPELIGKSFSTIKGVDEILKWPNIQQFNFHLDEGELIPELSSSVGRFAAIIGVGKSKKEVVQLLESAKSKLEIIVD